MYAESLKYNNVNKWAGLVLRHHIEQERHQVEQEAKSAWYQESGIIADWRTHDKNHTLYSYTYRNWRFTKPHPPLKNKLHVWPIGIYKAQINGWESSSHAQTPELAAIWEYSTVQPTSLPDMVVESLKSWPTRSWEVYLHHTKWNTTTVEIGVNNQSYTCDVAGVVSQ